MLFGEEEGEQGREESWLDCGEEGEGEGGGAESFEAQEGFVEEGVFVFFSVGCE